jgi:hypothetical protein
VCQLETLKTIAALCFFPYNIQHRVDQLSTFGVVTLGPVVASATLTKNKIVWSENLTKRTGSDGVHRAGFKIHQDGARYILSTRCLIVVDIYAFKLKVRVTVVGSSWVDTMIIRDDLPEL